MGVPMIASHIFSVSEITSTIKLLLEENIPTIWVEGEVSNYKAHSSGHFYFTLKDSNAQISCVMWRSRAYHLTFLPEDGMQIQVNGNIRVYEKGGRYQLDVLAMQPVGQGRLQQQFEALKQKLQAEGLFAEDHKKPLPQFPEKIGIVTSDTGAALRDILNVLRRRAPHVQVVLRPTLVQGAGAAEDISNAIDELNRFGALDLLIVGRGGGSLEDLWPFNEERVARAIYDSHLPVISAVGHEIDFTIADFVADLRAPTPSAAAELAVPDYIQIHEDLLYYMTRLARIMKQKISQGYQKIDAVQRSYGFRRPEDIVRQYALHIDDLSNQLERIMGQILQEERTSLQQIEQRIANLNPQRVLERGYSITYYETKVLKSYSDVHKEDRIRTQLANGILISKILQSEGK